MSDDAFDAFFWFDDIYGSENYDGLPFDADFDSPILDSFILKPEKENNNHDHNINKYNFNMTYYKDPAEFRGDYNFHFTGRKDKPARKELVLRYHEMIVRRYPKLIRPTRRDEQRNISKYFDGFSNFATLIIQTIIELENECKINYKEEHQALISKKKEHF